MGEFEGKAALITGAGSGLGKASAKVFVRERACVVVGDISGGEHDTAKELAGICRRARELGLTIALEFIPDTGLPTLPVTHAVIQACGEQNCGLARRIPAGSVRRHGRGRAPATARRHHRGPDQRSDPAPERVAARALPGSMPARRGSPATARPHTCRVREQPGSDSRHRGPQCRSQQPPNRRGGGAVGGPARSWPATW